MNENEIKAAIAKLLNEQTALTLSTTDGKDHWVATVFFVIDESLALYFLSGKDTRHSKHLKVNSIAVGSVFDPKSYFGKVWGVQIQGKITECSLPEVLKMGIEFVKKFPEAKKEFLKPQDLVEAAMSARFYKFRPSLFVLRTPEVKEKTGKSTVNLVISD